MNKPARGGKREGAGRKPLGDAKAVTVSICLPPDHLAKLDRMGPSRSQTIQGMIKRSKKGKPLTPNTKKPKA